MKISKRFTGFILLMVLSILLISCSKTKSPVEPAIEDHQEPIAIAESNSNRSVLAVYDAVIDPISQTFTVTPSERSAQYHFPLTSKYPNVLEVTEYSFSPTFWAEIKLTHPLPGSGIDAFDPRIIAILPANPGVSMSYPVFNVVANNSVILNPDGYTKLFDNLGGAIPGNTNPFIAYFKDIPTRRWSSTTNTEETKRWEMNIDGFGGTMKFKLVVDISTNYPRWPQWRFDNAPEPVEIDTTIGTGLTSKGDSALIEVTFLDWQGETNTKCKVEAPDLFDSVVQLFYSRPGSNPNEYILSGNISNSLHSPEGAYKILIAAWDIPSDIHIFSEVTANVDNDINFNPVDITPPWLSFSPSDIFIYDNCAYVAGGENGLHIFDLSNPTKPVWVNKVDTGREMYRVYVTGGYAYVVGDGLHIIDIDPPESAHLVKTLEYPNADGIHVSNGHAYVASSNSDYGLDIIDINPPESAHVVRSVQIPGHSACSVDTEDNYAYVLDSNLGLNIIDIDPPESAYVVKSLELPGQCHNSVEVKNGYVYVANGYYGLSIIDVNPPQAAHIVGVVDTPGDAGQVHIYGIYAYVTASDNLFHIIDMSLPESAYILKTVEVAEYFFDGFDLSDGYAYISNEGRGIQIIDIDPPESAKLVYIAGTLQATYDVVLSDGYAYVADAGSGFSIFEIDSSESVNYVKTITATDGAAGVDISDQYAYVFSYPDRFHIIDIRDPNSAYIVNTLEISGSSNGVCVANGYAYVISWSDGLHIVDVEPPELANIVKTDNTLIHPRDIDVSGDYAYVTAYNLIGILDVNPPESAHVIKTVDIEGLTLGIQVSDGYAFFSYFANGLGILDIDPPESAYLVSTVDTPGDTLDVSISGDYAFVGANYYGGLLQIIDINPISSANLVNSIDTPDMARGVSASENYAYVADVKGGLRIIKLW